MREFYGSCFIRNGELLPEALFNETDIYEGDSLYEVLRMMNGTPLFFDDHMARLENSVSHHGRVMLTTSDSMVTDINRLKKNTRIKDANLKIVFNYKPSGNIYLLYFVEPVYPSEQQYQSGVDTILFEAERNNPGIKIINQRLRSQISEKLTATGAFEAFLVDGDGFITEGSRSNVFFIKNEKIFTAPDDKVLGGITRKQVIGICEKNNIPLEYVCVHAGSLNDYDSVFITGTSPMVLPVRRIDSIEFQTGNRLVKTIMNLFADCVRLNISSFRK